MAAQTDQERLDALTNDMPLAVLVEIRENDQGQLALLYWALYTSEEGGWGKEPKTMLKKTKGRLFDTDIAAIDILDSDRTRAVLEMAHQEDNSNGPHQMKVDFTFSPGVAAFDQRLHSVPDHGLVGYELEKNNKMIWRPRPVIRAITPDVDMEDLYFGARVAALKENIREAQTALLAVQREGDTFAISDAHDLVSFLEYTLQVEYDKAA